MIPPTSGSLGTLQILKISGCFKNMQKVMVLFVYLPSNIVKNLIGLWDYMNLLIKQDRPADEKYNKLYYLMDEQWTKLTAHNMTSALIDEKCEKQNSHMSPAPPCHMPHFRSPTSPVPMRSRMYLELASFKKSIKREASAYSIFKR